jgi:hypothetical protein
MKAISLAERHAARDPHDQKDDKQNQQNANERLSHDDDIVR